MTKPGKRSREDGGTNESDDDGSMKDVDEDRPKSKKSKSAQTSTQAQGHGDSKSWELSSGRNPRRIEISEYRDAKLISIREFYEKDGEYLPGKKGISLSIDQYKQLVRAIPAVNTKLTELGIDVGASSAGQDDSELETKSQKRIRAKRGDKSNIEATSDEDEG